MLLREQWWSHPGPGVLTWVLLRGQLLPIRMVVVVLLLLGRPCLLCTSAAATAVE